MSALRAFAVTENDEGTGAIYFAEHDIVAKRRGANEFGDGELSYVSCRRVPWADEYAGKPVPARVMIENGWHFDCSGCEWRIDEDELRERRLLVDGVIGTQHGRVYCSAKCCRRDLSIERRTRAEQQRAIEALKAIVRKRFPEVEFTDQHENSNWRHHAYVTYHHGQRGWFWEQVSVSFIFPGMKIGPATLGLDRRWSSDIGPVAPAYRCCDGDREAFEAYAAATRTPA
jgi:hypothetical protein